MPETGASLLRHSPAPTANSSLESAAVASPGCCWLLAAKQSKAALRQATAATLRAGNVVDSSSNLPNQTHKWFLGPPSASKPDIAFQVLVLEKLPNIRPGKVPNKMAQNMGRHGALRNLLLTTCTCSFSCLSQQLKACVFTQQAAFEQGLGKGS